MVARFRRNRPILWPAQAGLLPAREAIADFIASRDQGRARAIRPENLFICASTSEAYTWLFELLCDPGDAILVPKPGYPLFDYLASLASVVPRPYRLEYRHPRGWSIDLDSLAARLSSGRTRAIVLINPNNPTGSYVGPEERRAILELCSRHGVAIVADEVFFGFPVETEHRGSFVGEDTVLTFALDGLSKLLGLPQAKLGWIACSGPIADLAEATGRLEIIADSYLSTGTAIMRALPGLLEREGEFGETARARIKAGMAAARAALEGPQSPHRVLRCDGGWTALVESPRLAPEEELAAKLLRRARLWSQPGYFFDMEREAYFTVSLILPPDRLAEGLRRYRDCFDELLDLRC
jgi:alanine-synthesizing transaminase